jgi:uncharacterized protein (DUF305 family)
MNMYGRLAAMAALSFIAMYILMYAMVDTFADVFPNINQFYMAGLMAAPMVIIELVLMGAMYQNRTANIAIMIVSVAALAGFFTLIRTQAAVGDHQFLKSMIPHHSGAVLMCQRADVRDVEVKRLCANIIQGQHAEITQMNTLIRKLEK